MTIYRYYKSTDEIFVDLMNRQIAQIDVIPQLEEVMRKESSFEEVLHKSFEVFAQYVHEVQKSIGGKFYYEIQVAYIFDEEKRKRLLSHSIYKKNLEIIQEKLVNYMISYVESQKTAIKYSLEDFLPYVCSTIDGICNRQAFFMETQASMHKEQIDKQFQMLADYCCTVVMEG